MRKPKNWTKRDAEAFLIHCLYTIGTGFHPDDDPADIVNRETREFLFTRNGEIQRMRAGIARALREKGYQGVELEVRPLMPFHKPAGEDKTNWLIKSLS